MFHMQHVLPISPISLLCSTPILQNPHSHPSFSSLQLTALRPADKNSWVGCGLHVPSVMDKVPVDEWCVCIPKFKIRVEDGEGGQAGGGEKEYPPRA
jgi:hypothetical protein